MLIHRNVLANTAQVAERTDLTSADRVLHVMPLFHVNGLMNNTILPLRAGASIVLRPRFDLGEFWGVVESFRPTYFTAVPTVFSRLMDAWDGRAKTASLRFVRTGAAPMTLLLQRTVGATWCPCRFPIVSPKRRTCTVNPVEYRGAGAVGLALVDEVVGTDSDLPLPIERWVRLRQGPT
jgi:acyl-CoA synthetase (AMP-forming)/AMP-acid ligase II